MSCFSRYGCLCLYVCAVALFSIPLLKAQTPRDSDPSTSGQKAAPAAIYSHTILPPEDVSINAKSAVLIDSVTGAVLLAHNAQLRIPPASFAKLLTLYVVFDALKHRKIRLEDEVFVSKKAWKTGGSKMFIKVNTKVPVTELLKGIAVGSGNDACVAIAEHVYGDTETFVRVMNKYAQSLGMTHSHFTNPHGLPAPEQLTTAHDMALLARNYLNHFPEAISFHSLKEYTYGGIRQPNRNGLLKRDASVDGLKTGWVKASGYNLVATAHRDQHRLIAVVMGARSPAVREQEALKLLNYGYQNFTLLSLFTKGQLVAELPVWQGARDTLPVLVSHSSTLVVPREVADRINRVPVLPKEIVAPVEKEQVLGKILITIGTDNVRSIPLIAGEGIAKAGFFKAFTQHIHRNGFSLAGGLVVGLGGLLLLGVAAAFRMRGKNRRRRPGYRRRRVR